MNYDIDLNKKTKLADGLIEAVLDTVAANMAPEDVFSAEALRTWAMDDGRMSKEETSYRCKPEEIYDTEILSQWALEHDFVLKAQAPA